MMNTLNESEIRKAVEEWRRGDIDRGTAMLCQMYRNHHDYITTHNLGTLILFEDGFAPYPTGSMDFGTESLRAIDLLQNAEKLKPGREKNVLALSLCYHFCKDFPKSLAVLKMATPARLKSDFLWMAAVNHMALRQYDQAQAFLNDILESAADSIHRFYALYAMIRCRYLSHEPMDGVMPLFRECVHQVCAEKRNADPWYQFDIERMLDDAVPIFLLFGENEDAQRLREKQGEVLMDEAETELLHTGMESWRRRVLQGFSENWDASKEIVFDLFEYSQ